MELDYSRHYQRWHDDSDEHYREMQNYYLNLLENYLPSDKEIKILEIGCGMGFCLMTLEELGYKHIEGIDIDQGQIQRCKSKNLNAHWVQDSMNFLSKKEDAYDVILAFDVIEHIIWSNQINFVTKVFSSLKMGGQFICSVPNANSPLAGRWRYIDWTHHISFTECSLDFLLYHGGFKKIDIFPIDEKNQFTLHPRKMIRNMLRIFFRTVAQLRLYSEIGDESRKIPLSLNILGVAKKQ
jgi:SAM-dependent methyltransferase